MQPRLDTPAPQPRERSELSDENRIAQAPQIARVPENPLPFSRGNSAERVEAEVPERARGPEEPPQPKPEPEAGSHAAAAAFGDGVQASAETRSRRGLPDRWAKRCGICSATCRTRRSTIRRAARIVPGATIQFDTKGVEFGPWLRRFVAQVRRNWFIPQAAMVMSGHVVLQFNIHRDGSITDLVILQPSSIEAFNNAAYGAIVTSNPTAPLPPEYPSDQALFTVTFYYNEEPPN